MTMIILLFGLFSNFSILFVGNSYTFCNDGLWKSVKQIYDSVQPDTLNVAAHTYGGATFQDHWGNQDLKDLISSDTWDFVVFQEQSCMPVIDPSRTYTYGDSLAWFATEHQAQPVFLMTWARKNDPFMLEGLDLGYSRMGYVHDSPVVPCGYAFDQVRRKYPEINPYSDDGAHPSVHGTYLAACVVAVTVFDLDILEDSVWYPVDITVEEAEILREVAIQSDTSYQQPSERE